MVVNHGKYEEWWQKVKISRNAFYGEDSGIHSFGPISKLDCDSTADFANISSCNSTERVRTWQDKLWQDSKKLLHISQKGK